MSNKNTCADDTDARFGLLHLLSNLPTNVKRAYRTSDEWARVLKRGGASCSINADLITKAIRYAPSTFECVARRRENVPGLDGRHKSYRFITAADNATPKSQRFDQWANVIPESKLPSIDEGYFHDDNAFRPHLLNVSNYYSSLCREPSTNTPVNASAPTTDKYSVTNKYHITDKHLNGAKRAVVIYAERKMFKRFLNHHCGRKGGDLQIIAEPTRDGYGTREWYECTACKEQFLWESFSSSRSEVVAPGRSRSRMQPTMNVEAAEAGDDEAFYPGVLFPFMIKWDMVHPLEKSSREAQKKCREAAIEIGEECVENNRKRAAAASNEHIEFEREGKKHRAAMVTIAEDGSALKRDYGHNYTGSAAAQCAIEKNTGSIVGLEISQSLAVCCIRAFNKSLREAREKNEPYDKMRLDAMKEEELLALMKHDGPCKRNSTQSVATAETHLAEKIGIDLMVDGNGSVREAALFAKTHVADGDSKGIKRSAAAQRDIVGEEAAKGNQFIERDWNHFIGNIGTEMRSLAKSRGYGGRVGMTVPRIERMQGNVRSRSNAYRGRALVPSDVTAEAKSKLRKILYSELGAIPWHHAGNHRYCTLDMCTYKQIQRDHPELSKKERIAMHDEDNEFGGKLMEVDEEGILDIARIITKRYNNESVDAICSMAETTHVEQTNGMTTKRTCGKRINLVQTNGYLSAWSRTVGHHTLARDEYNSSVLSKLGVEQSPTRLQSLCKIQATKDAATKMKQTDKYKKGIKDSKRFRSALRSASAKKDKDAQYHKGKDYSTGAVRSDQSPDGENTKTCGNCHVMGHICTQCTIDKMDDVVVYNGKKRRQKKTGSKPSNKRPAKRTKKNNWGISTDNPSSWIDSV